MIRRGHIYFADSDPTKGREQRGRRPVLVVSADIINQQPLVVTVVVGTDAANVARPFPTNVRVTAAESGLPKDTVFLCFHLRSIDAVRLASGTPAGALSVARMAEVERAIKVTLDLN